MTDMPERIWVTQECGDFKPNFRRFHASSLDHGPDYPEYTRSDLVPTWNRDLSAAPAGESVLLAATGGYVGKAFSPTRPGGGRGCGLPPSAPFVAPPSHGNPCRGILMRKAGIMEVTDEGGR